MLTTSEIKKLDSSAINAKVTEIRIELFELNLQKNTSSVEKTHLFKQRRRDIARLLTEMNSKERN